MKAKLMKKYIVGVACVASVGVAVLPAQAEQFKGGTATVNGSPVIMMKDNRITQALGGRLIDMDVWAGEFMSFDDNIYNTSSDKKSQTILATAAGFSVTGNKDNLWSFSVQGQTQYNDYLEDSEFDGFEGFLHAKGSVEFSPALTARALVNYDNTYDTQRDVEDIYVKHTFTTGAGVTLSPSPFMDFDVDYTYYTLRREDDAVKGQEYNEHTIALRPSYDLTPFLKGYLQFAVSDITPLSDEMNDSTSYSVAVGAAWAFKDTGSINASIGYKQMTFGSGGNSISADNKDDYGSMTVNVGVTSELAPDWSAGINLGYAPTYGGSDTSASNSNAIESWTSSASLKYSPGAGRFVASFAPFYNYSAPSADDDYAKYGFNIGASYVVTEWFNVNAGYTYSVTDYAGESGYDRNEITLGLAITF